MRRHKAIEGCCRQKKEKILFGLANGQWGGKNMRRSFNASGLRVLFVEIERDT